MVAVLPCVRYDFHSWTSGWKGDKDARDSQNLSGNLTGNLTGTGTGNLTGILTGMCAILCDQRW